MRLNWRKKIINYFTDADGNYILGIDNGMTPEKLIKKMGLRFNPDIAEGREIINRARIELNAFCKRACFDGYDAGSVSRSPSIYFIAQNNAEIKIMLGKTAKNLSGRLEMFKLRGQKVLQIPAESKINKAQKLINAFIPEEEK